MRWWYEEDQPLQDVDLSIENLLSHWDAIETDFHHFYGCDLSDGTTGRRTWRWFVVRLTRLLMEDTHIARAVGMPQKPQNNPTQ